MSSTSLNTKPYYSKPKQGWRCYSDATSCTALNPKLNPTTLNLNRGGGATAMRRGAKSDARPALARAPQRRKT